MSATPTRPSATTADEIPMYPCRMRAVTRERYGGPEVLELREVPVPAPAAGEVLVRVAASSLNIYDWHMTTGTPLLARAVAGLRVPKQTIPGADVAGTVVAVGDDVTDLAVGDDVFGDIGHGAFAEYALTTPGHLVPVPEGVPFVQAAAAPLAGLTALQGLRDVGGLQPGQRVLVNGASGGVGTFAVQIARALGAAEVTAVCSTSKVDQAAALGADRVVDYTRADYTASERGHHVLFDNVGDRPWSQTRRVLAPGRIQVMVTGPKHRWFGPLRTLAFRRLVSAFGDERIASFIAHVGRDDLEVIATFLATGEVSPLVEATYSLEEVPDALRYLGEGHARGKLVVKVADDSTTPPG